MKGFFRSLAAILLCVVLISFSLWHYEMLPDLEGVTAFIQNTVARINDIKTQLEVVAGIKNPQKPSDPGAVFPEYTLSTAIDAELESLICGGFDQLHASIDVSSYELSLDEVEAVVSQICLSHPEYFYVSDSYQCMTVGYGNAKTVTEIKPTYLYSEGEIAAMNEVYHAAIEAIVAGAPAEGSDFDKLLYLHDYFIENYTYDYTYTIRDVYQFFTQKTGVCQAYMLALIATAGEMGIESIPVTSATMRHAWNLVKLDGEWYHVDITWDDNVSLPTHTSYTYFLQSDTGLATTDRDIDQPHCDWQTVAEAKSAKYDAAIWRRSSTKMLRLNGVYYCTVPVEKEATLFAPESFCCALYSGSDPAAMQQEKEISAKWTTADKSRYYLLSYVGLATWNGKLVYNTQNTLHIYDPATGQDQTILLSIPANMSVYGIYRITASGEVTYVMDTKDISGYAIYPTYQIT